MGSQWLCFSQGSRLNSPSRSVESFLLMSSPLGSRPSRPSKKQFFLPRFRACQRGQILKSWARESNTRSRQKTCPGRILSPHGTRLFLPTIISETMARLHHFSHSSPHSLPFVTAPPSFPHDKILLLHLKRDRGMLALAEQQSSQHMMESRNTLGM